jgi:uncharacterized protein
MTTVYNLTLLAIDLVVLYQVRALKHAAAWFLTVFITMVVEITTAGVFTLHHFSFLKLAAYAVFLHGFILLAGSAIILWRRKRIFAVFLGISSVVITVLAYYVFLIEPVWLEVTHRQIASSKIDRHIRIVVLADLQTDRFGEYEQDVLRKVMEEKPDLILLAGDYIQAPYGQYSVIKEKINVFLREINFNAPYGIFAVGGNVDAHDWQDIFKDTDVTTVDAGKTFDLGPLRLTCLGLGQSYNPGAKVINTDPGKFHIVFGHVPNFALGRIEGDLLIAGHTHGGQVRVPFIGPIITLSRVPCSWAAGLTQLPGGAKLLVSRGIGMERGTAPTLRFLCRPELSVIDLTPDGQRGQSHFR